MDNKRNAKKKAILTPKEKRQKKLEKKHRHDFHEVES